MRRLVFLTFLFSFLFAQTYDSEIQPIFNNNCTSCHGTSGNLDLSQGNSYTNLVNVASSGYSGFQRVKPGDPMNSVLHQKIVGNTSFGDRMPQGGSALAQADEEKIKNWIQNGAVKDWSGGGAASSYSFDFGPGGYIKVPSPIKNESKWSIEFWMKFHQKPTSGEQRILFQTNNSNDGVFGFDYEVSPSDKFALELKDPVAGSSVYIASSADVFDQAFHHFYFEGDGSLLRLYIDGTEKVSIAYTGNFPNSDNNISIGTKLDGNLDEIRMRDIAGFPGVPTSRYAAGSGTHLLFQFDDQNATTINDNSGENNHGTIEGQANYEGDVYASGGGGTQGINLTVTSNETLTNEEILVGFMGPGKDPNYWDNRSWDHSLGNYTFPGSHQFLIPRSDLLDGNNYHLLVFADLNNDKMLDDATEHKGTSMPFSISGGTGNAGTINLNAPGGGGTELYTGDVEVVIKSIAPFVGGGNLWLEVYENENVKPIDALPDIPEHAIFRTDILLFNEIPVTDAVYTFKYPDFPAHYDSGYAFVAWYDIGGPGGLEGAMQGIFNVTHDPYGWGTFHVNRQSIEQGNKLKLEMHLHFVPGPEISPPSASSIQANKGEELPLSFAVSASQMTGSEVEYAEVHYWVGLESGIEGKYMGANNNGDGTWTAMIPAYDLTMGGLAIQYGAEDKIGVWSWTSPNDVQVGFPDLAFEPHFVVTNAETYEMISVPAVLQNYSSDAVLADELGGYDKKKWRLFKWSNGQYVESNVSFTPGAAYWLITKNEEQINTGPGKSTPIFSTTRRNLSDGWNMVGNPYYFPINLAGNVVFSENVEPTLYQWNGSSYNNTTNMMPKGGNWVYSNGSGMMEFFPMWGPGSQSEAIPEGTVNDEEDFNWKAKIITKAGNRYDKTATFGVHESASDTWDRFDYHEPPVIGDYISMAFDNNSWTENGGSYSQDIRSEGRTQTWNLAARSNIKGIVSLNLEDIHDIPSHQDVRLVDPVLGIVYNLRSEKAVTFTSQGTENPYYFKLIVGAADDIQSQLDDMGMVPNDFELFQNTPNPFNPVTNIRVSLVEDARITLKVYNLLGKEVNTLALNQSLSKGNHRFIWAGKDDNGYQLPSGVYLYRIEINSHVGRQLYQSTKKMVLMK